MTRSYLLHIPPQVSPGKSTPVVLVFHGAATNANFMMNQKADAAGFVVAFDLRPPKKVKNNIMLQAPVIR